jgi:ADP-heptose:LPS heptosyltransferase
MVRELTAEGYEVIVYPLHTREYRVEHVVGYLAAKEKIASQGQRRSPAIQSKADSLYSRLIPATQETLFEFYRNHEFFQGWLGAGLPFPPFRLDFNKLPEPPAIPGPYLVLFPGASAKLKRWPTRFFAQIADFLAYNYDFTLVVAGSPSDAKYYEAIQRQSEKAKLLNYCGQTNLLQLIRLIGEARLLLSNDTVAIHIAAACGTPFLCVAMGENLGKFVPYPPDVSEVGRYLFPPEVMVKYRNGDFTPLSHKPDISAIKPEVVTGELKEMLRGVRGQFHS